MKINEFVEYMGNGKNKKLNVEQLQQLLVKTIEVKDYISIKEKKELVNNIVNECILYEDGIFKFNDIDKYVCFTMKAIEAYTNLELSDDIEEDYDVLCRAKLLNMVIDSFNGEYENVKLLLAMQCDYVLSSNNVGAQFGKFLSGVLEKVEIVTNTLSDKVKDIDLDNIPVNANDLNKLMDFINVNKE